MSKTTPGVLLEIRQKIVVTFRPISDKCQNREGHGMNSAPEVEAFYTSTKWRKCRKAYAESKGNLCERCLERGIIEPGSREHPLEVHHKVRLSADNLNDPTVALSWSNLVLLCDKCHHEEHERRRPRRWSVDQYGRVRI